MGMAVLDMVPRCGVDEREFVLVASRRPGSKVVDGARMYLPSGLTTSRVACPTPMRSTAWVAVSRAATSYRY